MSAADSVIAPSEIYTQRLMAREAELTHLDKIHARIGSARLLLVAAIAVAAWLHFGREIIGGTWLLALAIVFVGIVLYHHRLQRVRSRAQRAADFYRRGLARVQGRWQGKGQTGERFNDPHHVYAADLDLFGTGSLFELLSTARTQMGESTLAQWLLSPASSTQLHERHASIADLRTRLDLCEALAILGESPRIGLHPDELITWAEAANQLDASWIRWTAPLLALLALATAAVWGYWGLASPFLAVLAIEACVAYLLRERIQTAIAGVENAFEDLKLLSALLSRLEQEEFSSPPLRALILHLSSQTLSASRTLARLTTIVNFVESRRNPLLRPFNLPLLYEVHVALAAERWRRTHGKLVHAWLDSLGEIEALISLAGYSFEHPDDPFPQFQDGPAKFAASNLGHPLIPLATSVRNDIELGGQTHVLLVSGSNMSGKSTLLRTIGINTVLAMAGAPVHASGMRLTPLQVGASIRVNDSLQEGSSRFYAEITRLRQLFEIDATLPLLFLLDELLQGTNSKDRLIGAEGIVRALVERGAIGLISTHDLALTEISGLGEGTLRNVHLQDELENGVLKFDFKLRDGVVTKSNGIELMRSIGLKV